MDNEIQNFSDNQKSQIIKCPNCDEKMQQQGQSLVCLDCKYTIDNILPANPDEEIDCEKK